MNIHSIGHNAIIENIKNNLLLIEDAVTLREGLQETPERVFKMYDEIFDGYKVNPEEYLVKTFDKELDTDKDEYSSGIVIVKDIDFYSHCEHHMVPFYGKVHIGYLPGERVVGLSKLVRVVNGFAHRLQVQERLGEQIADCIYNYLEGCKGVIVIIEAVHLCMVMRGVKNPSSKTITSCIRGEFIQKDLRDEFMMLLKNS